MFGGKMEEDVEEDREIARAKFNRYIDKAKLKVKDHNYNGALKYYKKAATISCSKKLTSKIAKLEKFLEELETSDEDEATETEEYEHFDGFKIYQAVWEKLYPHQQIGVKWFWGLHKKGRGGILGDDMGSVFGKYKARGLKSTGRACEVCALRPRALCFPVQQRNRLGKTIQVIVYLSGLFDAGLIQHVIIVMPKSLMPNWTKEFEKWAPGIHLADYHGVKSKREKALEKVQQNGGVILTTYGMIVSSCEQLTEFRDKRFIWDYLILDEGHKIKNANKTSKSVRCIGAKYHFILTGTPIQNNLSELWSLVDFVTEGKLLGTLKTFKTEFENPIVRARERDASQFEKRMGNEISNTLRKMLENIFLRRTKGEIFGIDNKENDDPDGKADVPPENDSTQPDLKIDVQLSKKNDLIIWLYLSDIQLKIYKDFLEMDSIREAMVSTKSPLAHLTMLKKIADHPRLLSSAVCATLGLSEDTSESEMVLLQESSKLRFTLEVVLNLKENGHRVLIFSQSRKMLDIVDKVLTKRGIKLLRFDGRIIDPVERQNLIKKFENDQSYTCFLLTTQVGAVGLNLTAADRVIIFDPSWNPGNDAQAVDRAYRIGQQKDVIIYRLITCGSIEEKIYRKQLFKQSISKQTTGSSKNPLRYFAKNQLRDLFILEDPTVSITHGILVERHGQLMAEGALETHLSFLKSLDIFGISDQGLVFSKEAQATKEAEDASYDVQIQERAKRAKELVTSEVNLCERISEMSLIDSKSTKKAKKNKVSSATDPSNRVIIPDSPTSDFVSISSPGEITRSEMVETPYPAKEYHSENLDDEVITINDSLEEDPAKELPILPIKERPKESPVESPWKTENSMTTEDISEPRNPSHQESARRVSDPGSLVPKQLNFSDIAETQKFGEIDPAVLTSPVCIESEMMVLPAVNNDAEIFECSQLHQEDHEIAEDVERNEPEDIRFREQNISNRSCPVPQHWVENHDDSLKISNENYDDSLVVSHDYINDSPVVSHEICDYPLQVSRESIVNSPATSRAVYNDSPFPVNNAVAGSTLAQGTMSKSCNVENSCDIHVINQDQSFKRHQAVYCSDSEEGEIQPNGPHNSVNISNIDDSIKNFSLCSEEAAPPSHISSDASFAEVVDYNGSPINIAPVKTKRYSNTPQSFIPNGGLSIIHTNTPSPKIAATHKDLRRSAAENVMQQRLSHGGCIPEVNNSSSSPFPGINHSLTSPSQQSTSSHTDLRRSAVGLIYGLTPTQDRSDASSVSVEVVNMACSPIDFQETVHNNQAFPEMANRKKEMNDAPIWNLASASPDTFQSFEADRKSFGVGDNSNELQKYRYRSPHVRSPKVVSSSTPDLDTSDRSNERKSFQWSALTNLQAALQSHASHGSSQYAGSESLFSNSPLTLENRCTSQNASENQSGAANSSRLAEGSNAVQMISQVYESEPLFSEHVSSNVILNSHSHCSGKEPVSREEIFESELDSEVAETHPQNTVAGSEATERSSKVTEAGVAKESETVLIRDESAETNGNSHVRNITYQESYRSLHIIESSDSDHSDNCNDQAIDESDPEIKLKEKSVRITQNQGESLQSANGDDTYDSDAESISSNEMNMISMLSGGRLSTANYDYQSSDNHDSNDYVAVASNIIGDDSSDSGDSASDDDDNDEMLIRSRRSLRMSILSKPKSSPMLADVIDVWENSAESALLCRSGVEAKYSVESIRSTPEQPFHPEQEAETQIMPDADSQQVNYVWDMPFYRRTPGREAKKNCFQECEDIKPVEKSPPSPENTFKCPCGKHSSELANKCECMLNADDQLQYRSLVKEARKYKDKGDHSNALSSYLKALRLANHDPRMKIAAMTLVKKLKQDCSE